MTFTDDDLKRLKEERIPYNNLEVHGDKINALLARLEAAERVCDAVVGKDGDWTGWEITNKLLEAWRKAAGRK